MYLQRHDIVKTSLGSLGTLATIIFNYYLIEWYYQISSHGHKNSTNMHWCWHIYIYETNAMVQWEPNTEHIL